MVTFDLPVGTKAQRKRATAFREFLLDDGFHMVQWSVYARACVSYARQESKRYAKPLLTLAKVLSPFTPPRQSAAPALQPKLQASVPQSSSSWPRADV